MSLFSARNVQQLTGLVWLLVASCKGGPKPFATEATYDAPKSGLRAIVYAKGAVAPHQDLSVGTSAVAVVCPTAHAGHPIRLEVAPPNATPREVSIADGTPTTMSWAPGFREGSLARALENAGYPAPNPAELSELADSIDGVALGPRATRIAGQTLALMVAKVNFEATAPPTLASCAAP